MGEEVIMKSKEEKDLGVVIKDNLSPEAHIRGCLVQHTRYFQISG